MAEKEEFLNVISDEYMGTVQISEQVGYSRRHTAKELKRLEEEGLVEMKKESGNLHWRKVD